MSWSSLPLVYCYTIPMGKIWLKTFLQISGLFVLPLVFFYFSQLPIEKNVYIIDVVALVVIAIVVVEKWSLKDLGIRFDNFKECIVAYGLLTLIAVIGIFLLAQVLGNNTQDIFANAHFKYGFVIISFLQEFLFRSFLIAKLKLLTSSPITVIVCNGILFGLIHVIFANPLQLFVLSSLLGIGFAYVYYYRPNLILAVVAHSLINFVAVYYCFASFNTSCI